MRGLADGNRVRGVLGTLASPRRLHFTARARIAGPFRSRTVLRQRKVDGSGLPISTSLGVLGLNGLTAYFALLEVGQPGAGETVVVSTAAGDMGACVGQIAKIKGCRAVGIAGGPDKVRMCPEDFRYDSALDYKADDLEAGGLWILCVPQ